MGHINLSMDFLHVRNILCITHLKLLIAASSIFYSCQHFHQNTSHKTTARTFTLEKVLMRKQDSFHVAMQSNQHNLLLVII